jgi:hypothetical protein
VKQGLRGRRRESFYWHLLSTEFAGKFSQTRVPPKKFTNSKPITMPINIPRREYKECKYLGGGRGGWYYDCAAD